MRCQLYHESSDLHCLYFWISSDIPPQCSISVNSTHISITCSAGSMSIASYTVTINGVEYTSMTGECIYTLSTCTVIHHTYIQASTQLIHTIHALRTLCLFTHSLTHSLTHPLTTFSLICPLTLSLSLWTGNFQELAINLGIFLQQLQNGSNSVVVTLYSDTAGTVMLLRRTFTVSITRPGEHTHIHQAMFTPNSGVYIHLLFFPL